MNDALANLAQSMQPFLWLGFAIFVRVSAVVSLLPGFGERSVPMRIKLGIAFVFSLVILPAAPVEISTVNLTHMTWIVVTETVAGLSLGIGMRLFILGLQTAGSIAAQSTSLAQVLGGAAVDPMPAMGFILLIGALCLAMMAGLHIKAVHLLLISYEILPFGHLPSGPNLSEWGLNGIRRAFSLAFTLAAPFILLSVLYNLAIGVINKAMPQLMVAFVGAPVITAGGLLLLFLSAPLILETWLTALDSFLVNPLAP